MPRETWIYDPERGVIPKSEWRPPVGLTLIGDIEPYRAMGSDVATGNAPVIGGRAQHREYLRRNGYVEIGNESFAPRKALGDYLNSPRGEIVEQVRQKARFE